MRSCQESPKVSAGGRIALGEAMAKQAWFPSSLLVGRCGIPK
jgi:hypothetical protein